MVSVVVRTISLIACLSFVRLAYAQPPNDDCADALTLCADQALNGNNTGSLGGTGFCPATSDLLWYTFTTNSIGGDATVTMSDLNCLLGGGLGNMMSMVILDGTGACTLPSFSGTSPCENDSMDFSVTATGLMANTQYWLLISGSLLGGAIAPANCAFSITLNGPGVDIVDVDFDAGTGFEIQAGETVQLDATGPGPTWSWSPTGGLSGNNIPNPFANPTITTTYTITETINGCVYSDTVTVEVVRLISPPNMFTPNGDMINDTWEIVGIGAYPNASVTVFDRWGQKVFSVNGYTTEWDGTRNGKALATGTYYYHIELNRIQGQVPPITGAVSIVK